MQIILKKNVDLSAFFFISSKFSELEMGCVLYDKIEKNILRHILVTFIILCDIFLARYFFVNSNFLVVIVMLLFPISIVATSQWDYSN